MNIKIINKIIKEIRDNKCNFVIMTNIPRGIGINGVEYNTYYGYIKDNNLTMQTEIVDAKTEENYVELYTNNSKVDYPFVNGGKRRVILDADSIVAIELIEHSTSSRLPDYLP